MRDFKNRVNSINPFIIICGYFSLVSILILFKISSYEYNLSALIGIWKGFAELNPNLINKGFIVYNDGGYDGQFFYMISKSIFTEGFQSFPILDSFFLRFNRIGLPLLSGVLNFFLGFQFYPLITLQLLLFFHVLSFYLLHSILDFDKKYLTFFYLFSPFSLNSILLLVSDSLFVSFAVLCIYQIKIYPNQSKNRKTRLFILFITALMTCLIKEFGLIVIFSLSVFSIYEKNFRYFFIFFLALVLYILITQSFKLLPNVSAGTNPLGFLDLIDYPLFGFFKSIQIHNIYNFKSLVKEMAKFPIFLFYLILFLNLKNIKNIKDLFLFLPILFIIFTAGVGEVGYWLSFDNISRMFTISLPWIIFLKQEKIVHNDYYALILSFLILLFLIIRIVIIKAEMSYFVF